VANAKATLSAGARRSKRSLRAFVICSRKGLEATCRGFTLIGRKLSGGRVAGQARAWIMDVIIMGRGRSLARVISAGMLIRIDLFVPSFP
jgi:hypothetical protein